MMSLGLSLGAFADGFAGGLSATSGFRKKAPSRVSPAKGPLDLAALANNANALGATPPPADGGMGSLSSGTSLSTQSAPAQGGLIGLLNKTEGGGDYDTLFGFANRDGGKFAGTKISNMTLGDIYKFTDPSGDYGQWVKANNDGVVATPVGKFQFVGSTARGVASRMGLPDDTPFNQSTQDAMFNQHARDTLAGASTIAGKRAKLRSQWVGLKSVPDDQLDSAITEFESFGNTLGALRPVS